MGSELFWINLGLGILLVCACVALAFSMPYAAGYWDKKLEATDE